MLTAAIVPVAVFASATLARFTASARGSVVMPIPMHAPASVPARTLIVLMAGAVLALAQEPVLLDGKPVRMIANDKVTLAVRSEGGAMVRLVLNDDPAAVNPLHAELGHFVCVDGFGLSRLRSGSPAAFLMFYTRTPDGFQKVDEVVLANGKVTATDATSGVTIALAASRPL
jgi:hypothetical protein